MGFNPRWPIRYAFQVFGNGKKPFVPNQRPKNNLIFFWHLDLSNKLNFNLQYFHSFSNDLHLFFAHPLVGFQNSRTDFMRQEKPCKNDIYIFWKHFQFFQMIWYAKPALNRENP